MVAEDTVPPGRQAGFTLIELMMVVAIIGILASIAIGTYQVYTIRAYVAEGMGLMSPIKSNVEDYHAANGVLPTNNASAGVATASSITGNAVSSVAVQNGAVVITYNNTVANGGATLIFVPVVVSGSVSWRCNSGTLSSIYVPSICRG